MATGFGCLVVGPAGSGKVGFGTYRIQSTFCHVLQDSGESHKRMYKVCNLDPAAEVFKYKCDIGNSLKSDMVRYKRPDFP